jgi:hypothetical protein
LTDEEEEEELDSENEHHPAEESDPLGRRNRFWACHKFEDGSQYEGNWIPEAGVDVSDNRVSRELKMSKMDGAGIYVWADGRRFEGIFSAGFPKTGRLTEVSGEVFTVQFSGDKTLQDGAEPIKKDLTVDFLPADLQIEKVVEMPQLLESSPVDAYVGLHSGLLGHTVPLEDVQRLKRSSSIAKSIRSVVGNYISHGYLHTIFRSQEGIWRKEMTTILEILSKSTATNESTDKSSGESKIISGTGAKSTVAEPMSQMDLMLELLCVLVVNTADEAQANSALMILQRFLSRFTPGMLSSPAALKESGFTEAHLNQYTTMVEQLFNTGSARTKDIAAQCLMGISTARGGLRHLARAITFLQNAGGTLALSAMANVEKMLQNISSSLYDDIVKSNAENPLDGMLAVLWEKFGSRNGALPRSSLKAFKVLINGLFRLFSCRSTCILHFVLIWSF